MFFTYGSMISCKDPPHLWGAYSSNFTFLKAMIQGEE
jgi:hypothetical protein